MRFVQLVVPAFVTVTVACGPQPLSNLHGLTSAASSLGHPQRDDVVRGVYGVHGRLAAIVDLPILGKKPRLSTWYGLASIAEGSGGGGMSFTERLCHVDVGAAGPVSQVMDDAAVRTVAPWTSEFKIWTVNDEVHFEKDWGASAAGAHLQDPAIDPLPTAVSDARVFDQDNDGKPGISVHVRSPLGNGDVYLVKRYKSKYSGLMTNDHEFKGIIQDAADQQVLDASNPRIKVNPPTVQNPDLNRSPLELVKIADDYDCDHLLANKDAIFHID